jgi:formyltetrahydrofolate synthetase
VKFLELKCPVVGRGPDAVVIVVTAKAVLEHGDRLGVAGHPAAVAAAGVANVEHHVGVLRSAGIPVVVAVNRFPDDDPGVLAVIDERARAAGAFAVVPHEAYVRGGAGAEALAAAVLDACERGGADHRPLVDPGAPVRTKVERLATGVFGADGVDWSPEAEAQLDRLDAGGFGSLPVCVAKTHLSISHDPSLAGAPRGHRFPVRSLRLYAGAGFVTVYAGDILTMPAFGARPRFVEMDLGPDGEVLGLA